MKKHLFALSLLALLFSSCSPKNETLHVLSTNDVHGAWFDRYYVSSAESTRTSLMAVNSYVDSIRALYGKNNVLLLDSGDCLQGDNAAYYYNYVDTNSTHLFSRIVSYMAYDAVAVGNHDIETGPRVYDKIERELAKNKIPFLAANAIKADGQAYFPEYKVFKRAGMRVLVIGFTNPNIQAWLDKSLWPDMDFLSLIPLVQQKVDVLKSKTKADVVIVSAHSGTGKGDGNVLENQGLDLLKSLKGVDLILCAHDHNAQVVKGENCVLVNSGSRAKQLGHATISLCSKNNERTCDAEIIQIDKNRTDSKMREYFEEDYQEVKAFTLKKVGSIESDMRTCEAFAGQSFYMNLIHKVQLEVSGADISFSAPLTFNKVIKKGELVFNDMFTIYPYENSLNVLKLTGKEIKDYLEYSYDKWIVTIGPEGHIFNMSKRSSQRYDTSAWSFNAPSFNFDSAAGIDYTVDVTKPYGQRITIAQPFDLNKTYTVAMTSYRAAGGGDLLFKGAGLSREELEERLLAKYPEIRDMIYRYIQSNPILSEQSVAEGIGNWHFIPEKEAKKALEKDMYLLFDRPL